MVLVLCAPFVLQGALMFIDEFVYHRRRGLGRWERLGHPLDTLTVLACFLLVVLEDFGPRSLQLYVGLSAFSCLFITKDEFVHKRECEAMEAWLHSVLFVLHPLVFLSAGVIWYVRGTEVQERPALLASADAAALSLGLRVQLALILSFLAYQVVYWSLPWTRRAR